MNDSLSKKNIRGINYVNAFWIIVSQWKAILLVALFMALFTTGYKYYIDINDYKIAIENKKQSDAKENLPVDEQIEEILVSLPEDQRTQVEFLLKQKEWVSDTKEYLNNSILINVDPASQRTLVLSYYLSMDDKDSSEVSTLAYKYSTYVKDEKVINELQKIIAPDTKSKYIAELITVPNFENRIIEGDDLGLDVILEVDIVLPEAVDASSVEKVISTALLDRSSELNKTVCPHNISLINVSENHVYNSLAVSNKNSLIANIYNIESSYIKNSEMQLSPEQRAAIDEIVSIKKIAEEKKMSSYSNSEEQIVNVEEAEISRPGFSKKYFLLGFILGGLLYVGFALTIIVMRGRIMSSDELEAYTGSRVVGEVYYPVQTKGIEKLLCSNIVDEIRYCDKSDVDVQIEKTVSTIDAVCEHSEITDITLINMVEGTDNVTEVLKKIILELKKRGRTTTLINEGCDIEERMLLPVKHAVIASGSNNTSSDIVSLSKLFNYYEIHQLGNIYICPRRK